MHNNDMLDELYVEAVDNLKNRKHTPTLPCRDPAQDAKDHYVNVRTNVRLPNACLACTKCILLQALLFWILSNVCWASRATSFAHVVGFRACSPCAS